MLRRILLWRFSSHVWTFNNAAALVMLMNGLILLTSPYRTGSVFYFNFFLFGLNAISWLSLGMIINALLMFFRRLKPAELFIAYLPMWFYGFVLIYVTVIHSPRYTWTLVLILTQPLVFVAFRIMGKLFSDDR